MAGEFDGIVLGAGPTGENAADRAVRGGLTAAIVESELVGGECSYWACMPSKAMLRPVAAVAEADHLRGVAGARLAPAHVLARRDSFASDWKDDGQVKWLDGAGIELFRGQARIAGERRVKVGDTELTARHAVVICTGTRAVVPDSLDGLNPWTSREATSAHAAPGRLAIVGGGVVGCEMAAAWQALGTCVTLLSRGRLLDRLPPFAGDLVARGLRAAGVDVRLGACVTHAIRAKDKSASGWTAGHASGRMTSHASGRMASRTREDAPDLPDAEPTGPLLLTLDDGSTVAADELLAATGRAPRTEDIGLESVGLKPGSWLDVDDTMRVRAVDGGWLYAAGDVNHLALLTHMGKYQARICGDAIAARARGREPIVTDRSSKSCVPQMVFTVPEVASVGLTREQAEAAGMAVR